MHARTVFLNVQNEEVPRIDEAERIHIETPAAGVLCLTVRYGFREEPDIPAALEHPADHGRNET